MAFRKDVAYLDDCVPALVDLTAQEYLRVSRLVDTTEPILTDARATLIWEASARDLYEQRMSQAQDLLTSLRSAYWVSGQALAEYEQALRVAKRWVEEGDASQRRLADLIAPLTRWQTPRFHESEPLGQWEDLRSTTGFFDRIAEFMIRDDVERIRAEADRHYYAAAHAYDRALRVERLAADRCVAGLKEAVALLPHFDASGYVEGVIRGAPGMFREIDEAAHLGRSLVRLPGQGPVPRDFPVFPTNGVTELHQRIIDLYGPKDINGATWDTLDWLGWEVGVGDEHEAKLQFVRDYRSIINVAAYQYGIPAELLAGVAYKEFGGKPMWVDDAADWTRQNVPGWVRDGIQHWVPVGGPPDDTSYGPLAIQVDTAARALGYDAEHLTAAQREAIIASLKDPEQCIVIAAKVLHDAKQATDFALVEPADMTEAQIHQLAAVYNGGPHWAAIEPQGYADDLVKHLDEVSAALH